MMKIFCDICERIEEHENETDMTAAGWMVAEDDRDTEERHGLCPKCQDEQDEN